MGKCSYHGQVNKNTGKPNGVGLVVKDSGDIYEGQFKNGFI